MIKDQVYKIMEVAEKLETRIRGDVSLPEDTEAMKLLVYVDPRTGTNNSTIKLFIQVSGFSVFNGSSAQRSFTVTRDQLDNDNIPIIVEKLLELPKEEKKGKKK